MNIIYQNAESARLSKLRCHAFPHSSQGSGGSMNGHIQVGRKWETPTIPLDLRPHWHWAHLRLLHYANLCLLKILRLFIFLICFFFFWWQITVIPRHSSKGITCHNFKIHHCNYVCPANTLILPYFSSFSVFCFSFSFVVLGTELRTLNSTNELYNSSP